MSFKPNKDQQRTYDFIQNETGNAVLGAVAGSGKTTTILNALSLVPKDKTVLFLAFNKSIAEELKNRVPKSDNISVKTVHGYGISTLMRDFSFEVSSTKYSKMLRDIISFFHKDSDPTVLNKYNFGDKMPHVNAMKLDFEAEEIENPVGYMNRIIKLCDLGRLNLIDIKDMDKGIEELYEISKHHNIEIINGECFRAWHLIKLGIDYTELIDFTDMIYLPIVYNLKPFQNDLVFIDECQDLNSCQIELMLKAKKPKTGRHIAVGDKFQSIYGFAGSNAKSFEKLCSLPNTTILPLNVCYRCGTDIISKAQSIVPTITAFEGAKKGEVDYDADLSMIKDGDMVLSRNTFPIVKLCFKFLLQGRKASVMGSDIGASLVNFIKNTERKREQWTLQNMFSRLYDELDKVLNNIMQKEGIDRENAKKQSVYNSFKEKLEVVELLSSKCDTPKQVINHIDNIFSNNDSEGITLSTIHKSKGLESERVFIIHPETMPSALAKKEWEKEQEEHLRYVAITRAKSYLGFIDKSQFDAWADADQDSQSDNVEEVKESKWVGKVGEKTPLVLSIVDVQLVNSPYGETNLYEMIDEEGNYFSKFGKIHDRYIHNNDFAMAKGTVVAFNAKIKEHRTFKSEKITVLSTLAKYKI